MKFGKQLLEKALPEWKLYFLDYKALKMIIRQISNCADEEHIQQFFTKLSAEQEKIAKFYIDKESWCFQHFEKLNQQVRHLFNIYSQRDDQEKNQTIDIFYYTTKALLDFDRELIFLDDYVQLNSKAFHKILKKFDKRTGLNKKEEFLNEMNSNISMNFFNGENLSNMRKMLKELVQRVNKTKPEQSNNCKKVYTIGCFDVFHRGHENLFRAMREFGNFIVVGIHDDSSYFKLKNKHPVDNLEIRMNNIKPFVDIIFVIPATEPTPYIKAAVSQHDIDKHQVCYVRGEDMPDFPSRAWVEATMPVHLLPRSEGVSSTLLRTIYHDNVKEAYFAATDHLGRPIIDTNNTNN